MQEQKFLIHLFQLEAYMDRTDPDGNNTIRNYYWALNDTATWHELSSNVTTITLRETDGIVPNSNNRLYLKTKDISEFTAWLLKCLIQTEHGL
jgi:hypothetical protein